MPHIFNKILVCTDFSIQSKHAIIAAENLREITGGQITLLHICFGFPKDEEVYSSTKKSFNENIFSIIGDQAKEKMEQQIKTANAQHAKCLIKFGNTAEEIIDFLETESFDILFMGHGGKGRFEGILGSVARKVISATHLPVMVIKKEYANYKIAGLIDETGSSENVIKLTLKFYRISKGQEIEFLSLSDNNDLKIRIKDEVEKFKQAGESPIIKVKQPLAYNIAYELSEELSKSYVDIAVIKRRNQNKSRRLFLGSTMVKLLDVFPGNILICPD